MIEKMKSVWKNPTFKEIIRFLIVGGIATIVDYLIMGIFEYSMSPSSYNSILDILKASDVKKWIVQVGTTLGFLSGLIVNYICSIWFVYNEKGKSKSAIGFIIFAVLSLVGLGINNLGMYLGYSIIGMNQWICKIFMTIIVMIYNYVSKRLIIFKKEKKENGQD